MSFMGELRCRAATMGDSNNFIVSSSGVATFPIGTPTFQADQSFPSLGTTNYSNSNGLGISTSTTPSEAISKIDNWIETYLLDAPPTLTIGTSTAAVENIIVSWSNPPQKKLAFYSSYIPQITSIKADIVPHSDNLSQTWNASSLWTVSMETIGSNALPTVTSLKVVLDYTRGTSSLSNGVYSFYGTSTATRIVAETLYDIRVYAVNEAVTVGGQSPRYIYFYGIATLGSGPPAAPTGLSVGSITMNTALANWADIPNEDRDINSDATPLISRYQVNITPNSTTRYGALQTSTTTPQQTALASGSDAVSQLSLTTLFPGTNYSITVQAKNALNASYGSASSQATFDTSEPSAPSWPDTSQSIAKQASLVYPSGTGGYTLDGNTSVTPVLKYASVVSTPPYSSSKTNFRTNYTKATTAASTGTIEAFAGPTSGRSTTSATTVGFGQTFVPPVDSDAVRLTVSAEGDYYSTPATGSGYWKVATAYVSAISPSSYYRASNSPYGMYMKFTPTGYGSSITTTESTFYIDELNSLPSVIGAGIFGASDTVSYVTGVPTYSSTATFNFQTIISNLVYQFLRNDKSHFAAKIETSAGTALSSTLTVTKTNINGTTHNYYDAPVETYQISSTKHNSSGVTLTVNCGNIQFNEFTLQLSSASNVFNEALQLRVTPYNIQGTGTASVVSGYVNSSTGSTKTLRIDTTSVSALSTINSGSRTLQQCGTGQYPSSGYTSSYSDHSASIESTDQLQLVNGTWRTKTEGTGYKNYDTFYFPGTVNQPLYNTNISASGWRYVCFKFTSLKGSTYDSVTITFSYTGLTMDKSSNSANFRLYMKVVGSTTTPWVSCTTSINASGYDAISEDGQGCMNNGSSTSLGSINAYVPTGTIAGATVYIRFGLDMSVSQTVSSVNCTAV